MIPNLYLGNACFTKHPFKVGCLGYQENVRFFLLGRVCDIASTAHYTLASPPSW